MRSPTSKSVESDAPASRGRLWLFRLLTVVLAPILFLLLFEGTLRFIGYGHPTDFWLPIEGRDAVQTNASFGWRFFPPTLARRPIAQDLAAPKPDGTYRIFVLGGSAAMGIPDPAFHFGRVLEVMLEEAFPETDFEVVNAAMTAINSHVVLTIAEDCARLEPDLFIVYLGNNEVVGPWGAGSVLRSFSPSRAMIRASIVLTGTRTGQLLNSWIGGLQRPEEAPTGWQGMGLFVEHRVSFLDPRLTPVYQNFKKNLEGIAEVGRRVGAPILMSTVAVNLRQNPPFASMHRRDLSAEDQERFETSLAAARELALTEQWGEARPLLEAAVEIDDQHAEAQYLLGQAFLASGDRDKARLPLIGARDLDALRFRADSEIQRVLREVARKYEDVKLVDGEALMSVESPASLLGDELLWEHVHLNFAGNVKLAEAFLGLVIETLPEEIRHSRRSMELSNGAIAERLALTPWDQLRQAEDIHQLMLGPPFDEQFGYEQRVEQRREALASFRRQIASTMLDTARKLYQQALAERPDDLELRANYATLLRQSGDSAAAIPELEAALERVPRSPGWLTDLGSALMETGRFDEAANTFSKASNIDPYAPDLPLNLGILEVRRERYEAAIEHFRHALELDPGNGQARLNLAAALDSLDRPEEALVVYREAVERAPDRALPHVRLGLALAERGEDESAIASYREALKIEPGDATAHYNLGVALERGGELPQALHHYSEAIRYDPGNQRARDNASSLYGRQGAELAQRGDWVGAIRAFEQAVAVRPAHAPSRYNLAQALGMSGRIDEAVEQLRLTLDLARQQGPPELAADVEARLRALGVATSS